jgi:hypothetical protein
LNDGAEADKTVVDVPSVARIIPLSVLSSQFELPLINLRCLSGTTLELSHSLALQSLMLEQVSCMLMIIAGVGVDSTGTIDEPLTGVYLTRRTSHKRASYMGVHLMGVHLIGVHLAGVHLLRACISQACVS